MYLSGPAPDLSQADQVPGDLPFGQHRPPAQTVAGPLSVQPLPVDPHPRLGPDQALHLLGHRLFVRHTNLLQRQTCLHCSPGAIVSKIMLTFLK